MRRGNSAHQIRIIGGKWRGRKISFRTDEEVRPTPDRVRETLFNWLAMDLDGATCLELFAGSGVLSLEALSRRASHVTLVDRSANVCRQLDLTVTALGAPDDCQTICHSTAEAFLTDNSSSFDIVFLDPPFHGTMLTTLEPLLPSILSADSIVYVETGTIPPDSFAGLPVYRSKRAGAVHYALYRH
ncbi:MAG: 16S rRNA (guanine(966)-N(2))-methyltransferase RsmD [Proteobacteria bacterium]|jgi:16S rRNA (guanine966-N2)-methyltransferase|nr:16S rRNA (guanine(966)-N(2))-methyltransferase RsmD [Pseudomonadota bacterium]MDA1300731.1 16S rRNA (guanine(966)-N(2))-methyltransferase RsmD [Pseudomonadota bacterium]